jgi:hypothetical protein
VRSTTGITLAPSGVGAAMQQATQARRTKVCEKVEFEKLIKGKKKKKAYEFHFERSWLVCCLLDELRRLFDIFCLPPTAFIPPIKCA